LQGSFAFLKSSVEIFKLLITRLCIDIAHRAAQ
jgi:hypothetical protein